MTFLERIRTIRWLVTTGQHPADGLWRAAIIDRRIDRPIYVTAGFDQEKQAREAARKWLLKQLSNPDTKKELEG